MEKTNDDVGGSRGGRTVAAPVDFEKRKVVRDNRQERGCFKCFIYKEKIVRARSR